MLRISRLVTLLLAFHLLAACSAEQDAAEEMASGEEALGEGADSDRTFEGRAFQGVTLLWQGNWSYLVKCDSYSRAKKKVVFYCDESPSRSFVDEGAWIAVPRAYFSRGLCGTSARVCKGSRCVVATIVEKSETNSKWEASTAVLDALGVQSGFSSCTRSFGTATGVTVTLE